MIKPNNIYLGDSYELIKQLEDNSVDLIVTDPPYKYTTGGGGECFGSKKRSYHNEYTKVAEKRTTRLDANKIKNRNEISHLSSGIDYSILDEFVRVLKKINIYIFCSKHMIPTLLNYFVDKGCMFEIMFWAKTNPLPTANNTYLNDIEYLLFFKESGVKVGGTYETKSKFYVTSINKEDKDLYDHPTIKPIEIIKNLIINSSDENDVVLDTFLGSGTTAVAAKELGRRYIGFEIDEEYYKIAKDRLDGITQVERREKDNGVQSIFDFLEKE
jgi:DNA modification methylase